MPIWFARRTRMPGSPASMSGPRVRSDLYGSFSVKWFFVVAGSLFGAERPFSLLASTTGTAGRRSEVAGTGRRRGTDADGENGPAARSYAADAHDCIMVRIQTDLPHKSLVARSCAPMASSPRINTQGQALSDAAASYNPSHWSSSLRVLRRQGAAKHKRR